MKLEGLKILITSNEPWGDVWYSKHNYAYELSRRNQVVFVDAPPRWAPKALLGPDLDMREISPGLHVLSYRNRLPALTQALYQRNNRLVSHAIRSALAKHGLLPDLMLAFDPFRLYDPRLLGAEHAVFMAFDDHSLATFGERHIYANMDAFVTISQAFNKRYEPFGKAVHTISHAISSEEFNAVPHEGGMRGHGLFVGNIDARIDLAAVRTMATRFPSTQFMYMGPYRLSGIKEADALFKDRELPNIMLHPPVPFKEMGRYIADAAFCLAPLNTADPRNAVSHHKIFHYMALGKPIFGPVFSEYLPVGHLLYMRNDLHELLSEMKRFLEDGENPGLAAERIRFARTRTYEHVLADLGTFLGQHVLHQHQARQATVEAK